MSFCWLAPAQRPSLRELRIMLLHLRSSRDEFETAEFDRRWNQLMPRIAATNLPPVITSTNEDEETEMTFSLAPSSALSKHSPADMPVLPMVHSLAGPAIPSIVRPSSFDSEFSSEINASLVAHAGSRQTSIHSFSTSPRITPDDMTLDDSFTAMAPHFTFISHEQSLAADLKATTSSASAFEMVSYGKTGEAEVMESESRTKAGVDVNVSDNIPELMPLSAGVDTPPTEQAFDQETVKDNFDSGEEDWQCFGDTSANQNMSSASVSAADQTSVMVSKVDGDHVSVNVSNDGGGGSPLEEIEKNLSVAENGPDAERDAVSKERADSKDGSFCMLKVSVGEDDSLTKSLDIESPAKSTTSSADWCLLSNNTEHSREEELDTVSHVTDPSLPGDCVLVESKGKVAPEISSEEASNTHIGIGHVQESVSEFSKDSADDDAED